MHVARARTSESVSQFLTFSCAEYESQDISEYLKKVNKVPDGYNIGKLCTEDPVSVSRQFNMRSSKP